MSDKTEFKRCSCGVSWTSCESFIRDGDIQPIGMTFAPIQDNTRIYYFFNHLKCHSTLAVDVEDFAGLIEGPIPSRTMNETADCPRHCSTMKDLETCHVECHNAPFRRLLIDSMLKKDT